MSLGVASLMVVDLYHQAAFSIHYYRLVRYVARPTTLACGNLDELQDVFRRVLKCGLADLSEDGYDEEALNDERPGSPTEDIIQLRYEDARAVDFRNYIRTWYAHRLSPLIVSKFSPIGSVELPGPLYTPTKFGFGYIGPPSMFRCRPSNPFRRIIALFLRRLFALSKNAQVQSSRWEATHLPSQCCSLWMMST